MSCLLPTPLPTWLPIRRDRALSARSRGFTLMELLIVVSLITLLIAMLLPSLQSARNAARGIQCQSNLRQQGIAMTAFVADQQGHLPPGRAYAPPGGSSFIWTNDFVNRQYLTAPQGPSTDPANHPGMTDSHVFRCPSGLPEPASGTPAFPAHLSNQGAHLHALGGANERVASWYWLNVGDNYEVGANNRRDAPFVHSTGTVGSFEGNVPYHPAYRRHESMVEVPSRLVMIMETSTNWPNRGGLALRLAARHNLQGENGTTQLLFFDGHVGGFSTVPYQVSNGLQYVNHRTSATRFYLGDQAD